MRSLRDANESSKSLASAVTPNVPVFANHSAARPTPSPHCGEAMARRKCVVERPTGLFGQMKVVDLQPVPRRIIGRFSIRARKADADENSRMGGELLAEPANDCVARCDVVVGV